MSVLSLDVAEKLEPLLADARYKGAHGGRGGMKSHFFAEQSVLKCVGRGARIVCIREVQETIKDSVRQLLVNKISKLGIGRKFDILENELRGPNGGLIIFKGMQNFNSDNIKSLEDFDIAWIEEAQTLSHRSFRLLRPTIRKPGSEIWASWNPRYEDDAVDEFFRGPNKHPDAICVEVNWQDNPWFPDVLREEMQLDRAKDAEMAKHVWDGGYEIISEGTYFAALISKLEEEGRAGSFPHNPTRLVKTSWDIGVDDHTAIWFIQDDGVEVTVIDYYEASGVGAEQAVTEAMPEMLPDQHQGILNRLAIGRLMPFKYATHYLPHDVKNREWGGGAKSRVQTLMELGLKQIHAGVAQGPAERINAVRALLPICRFNTANPRVKIGLNRLRRYSRRYNESLQTFTTSVLHDINSHGSDAFGEFAINSGIFVPKTPDRSIVMPPAPKGYTQLPLPPAPKSGRRIAL